jgi:hypothetical protein
MHQFIKRSVFRNNICRILYYFTIYLRLKLCLNFLYVEVDFFFFQCCNFCYTVFRRKSEYKKQNPGNVGEKAGDDTKYGKSITRDYIRRVNSAFGSQRYKRLKHWKKERGNSRPKFCLQGFCTWKMLNWTVVNKSFATKNDVVYNPANLFSK